MNVVRFDQVRDGNGTIFVKQRADVEGTEIDVGGRGMSPERMTSSVTMELKWTLSGMERR